MCSGMIYNLVRKLTEDKEDIIASREKSLASLGIIGGSFPEIPDRTKSASSRNTSHLDCNGCYVPPPPGGLNIFPLKLVSIFLPSRMFTLE